MPINVKLKSVEYPDDLQPCVVAKKPCGCYVAACVLDEEILQEIADWDIDGRAEMPSLVSMLRDGLEYDAKYEVRPVKFVRGGGLNFDCQHPKAKS